MGVYLYPNNTETELKNAYIGEYQEWWQPWANTVAYYPLDADFNDASWNSRNLTNSWGTITTLNWITCAYYNGNSYSMYDNYSLSNTARTISWWVCKSNGARVAVNVSNYNTNQWGSLSILFYQNYIMVADDYWASAMAKTCSVWIWYNVVATQEWSTVKAYLNWEYIGESTTRPSQTPTWWSLWAVHSTSHNDKYKWYISNVILENKARTAQEVADYYNQTKATYGL